MWCALGNERSAETFDKLNNESELSIYFRREKPDRKTDDRRETRLEGPTLWRKQELGEELNLEEILGSRVSRRMRKM